MACNHIQFWGVLLPVNRLERSILTLKSCRIWIATLALCCLAPGLSAAFQYRQIEGWAVSCSNSYSCTISLTPSSSGASNAELSAIQWHRSSAPSAPLTLSLPFPPGLFKTLGDKGHYQILVDGEVAFETDVEGLARDDALSAVGINEPGPLFAMFEKMAAGKNATISYSGATGTFSTQFSLSGLSASADFVDGLQGRSGRTDALADRGERPPPPTTNVWPIDSYADLPESVLRNLGDGGSDCYTNEAHLEQADAFAYKSASGSTVMLLPCGPSGAYNQPFQLYVGKNDQFRRSDFPNVSDRGITVLDTVYNVSFDLEHHSLSAVYLGRGLGDCGLAHYWDIDAKAADNPLVLTHERSKSACDGEAIGAENWPVIWRAKSAADGREP